MDTKQRQLQIANNKYSQLSTYRFFNVFFYILADFSNSVMYATFSPTADILSNVYDLQPIQVTMATAVYLVLTPIFTFLANGFIDKYGPSVSIKLGCLITMAGAWVRIFINYNFGWAIAGQFIAGMAGPFIVNAKGKVGANWFLPHVIAQVSMIISIFTTSNGTIGLLIPGLWFGEYDENKQNQDKLNGYQEGKNLSYEVVFYEAIIISVAAIVNIIGYKGQPDNPPSYISTVPREDYSKALKQLIKNKDYILLLLAASFTFGSFTGLSAVLSFLIKPFGFGASDTAFIGISLIITGIIGCFLASFFIKNNKNYRKFIMISNFLGLLSLFLIELLVQTEQIGIMIIGTSLLGLFLAPQVAVYNELGCELVFPIGEGSAVGFIFASITLFGIFQIAILSVIVKGESKAQTLEGIIFVGCMMLISIILTFFVKQNLKRLQAENQKKMKEQQLSISQLQQLELQNQDYSQIQQNIQNTQLNCTNNQLIDIKKDIQQNQELASEERKDIDLSKIQINSSPKKQENNQNSDRNMQNSDQDQQYNGIDIHNSNNNKRLQY